MVTISDFDRKMIQDVIDNSSNQEEARNGINQLAEIITLPTKDIIKVCLAFDDFIKETSSKHNLDEKESKDIYNGLSTSFVCSVWGNMINIFNISDDNARAILESTIKQNNNIKKQDKE